MSNIAVIGAGASGMLSAILLAQKSHEVTLFESNSKVGKKILASGNGHCNISNSNISNDHYHGYDSNFVNDALSNFSFSQLEKLFKKFGLLLDIKDDGKAYPQSYEAKAVSEIFLMTALNSGVQLICEEKIEHIEKEDDFSLHSANNNYKSFDKVVVATGGEAAPALGGNDSGYLMAESFGHAIAPIYPSLVQLKLDGNEYESMSGTKRFSSVKLYIDKELENEIQGDILFTRYGISGLAILDLSQKASQALSLGSFVTIVVNFFPELDRQKLDSKIASLCKQLPQASFATLLSTLIHSKIVNQVLKSVHINLDIKASSMDSKAIKKVVNLLVNWKFTVNDTHGFKHAEVCGGGVLTSEVDSKTMQSKKVEGLYFVGEVLDIVGDRGGYNFHFAFATAHAMAQHI
jgi:predicted Rossmann fold flavoprotein